MRIGTYLGHNNINGQLLVKWGLDLGWWILILPEKDVLHWLQDNCTSYNGEKKGMLRKITLSDNKKIIKSIWSKKCNVQQLDLWGGGI